MNKSFIEEAFRQVFLEDVEEFPLTGSGPANAEEFMDMVDGEEAADDELISDVYDLEAEAEEDLKQSYIGKVILDCNVCHSNVFADPDQITENEDGIWCAEIECPYCLSNEGYTVIGEVKPYQEKEDVDLTDVETEEVPEEPIEDIDAEPIEDIEEEEDLEEGLKADKVKELKKNDRLDGQNGIGRGKGLEASDEIRGPKYKELNEECEGEECEDGEKLEECGGGDAELVEGAIGSALGAAAGAVITKTPAGAMKGAQIGNAIGDTVGDIVGSDEYDESLEEECGEADKLEEGIEDVQVTTEDETMTMTTKEDGGVVIETSPKEEFGGEKFIGEEPIEGGEEMIAPIEPETEVEIEDAIVDNQEDEMPEEEMGDVELDIPEDDEMADLDFEEFDEESFDNLGESYLKRCYENVTSFKTSNISLNENKEYIIEGVIGFDSGNKKKTQFIFKTKTNENGKVKLEGYNRQISTKGNKTFKLNCSTEDKRLVCESLNYNYKGKNNLNESVRVYGTVKRR